MNKPSPFLWVTLLVLLLSLSACRAQETIRGRSLQQGSPENNEETISGRSLQGTQHNNDEGASHTGTSVEAGGNLEEDNVNVRFGGTSSASGNGAYAGGQVRAEGTARVNRTNAQGDREFIFEERSSTEEFGNRNFTRSNRRNRTNSFDWEVPGFARGTDLDNGIDFDGFLDTMPQVEFRRRRDRERGDGEGEDSDGDRVGRDRGPAGNRLFNLFYQNWLEDTTFVDLSETCPSADASETGGDPLCVVQRDGEDIFGTWVCRTLYHPTTGEAQVHTACIDPFRGLEKDECGCCEGMCPAQCGCPCNLRGRGEGTGVRVRVETVTDDSDTESMSFVQESCMQFATALRYTSRQQIRANVGSFACVEECTE